jgi:hypothetical protein
MRRGRVDTDGVQRARHAAAPGGRGWLLWRPGRGSSIAAVIALLLIAIVMAGGVVIGHRLAARSSPPAAKPSTHYTTVPAAPPKVTAMPGSAPSAFSALITDFDRLKDKLNAQVGVVIKAVGSDQDPIVLGDFEIGKAWSTMKVPLAIAALQEEPSSKVTDTMIAAITESDNAAAEKIWASLGDPDTAAHKVEEVLGKAGDPTRVESKKVRLEFTAFGQSDWALVNQVRFISYVACQNRDAPILNLMGQIKPDQRWGLGSIANIRFKGGWGPSPTGQYLVRQMGVLTMPTGQMAVAVAVQPTSGSFDDGTKDLTEISNWLTQHLGALPMGRCDRQ